ncbi:MAG: phosphatidylserine decarboxylase [Deltaproteobacteria bacterium]|nr:phosphatidylserine decarboxylase [Deltaproteobacteria bacterium]
MSNRMTDTLITRLTMGVCGAMGALAEIKAPKAVLQSAISAYSLGFGVNRSESAVPPDGFSCFGDFFARNLLAGTRPVCQDDDAFVSPCDGQIAAIQSIHADCADTFRVKGFDYSIQQLVGTDCGNLFSGGRGMVIYLHPRDYHRVHVPVTANLRSVRHIAGARFPVAPWAEKRVSGIFQRNERMVFQFDVAGQTLILVMVAAFGVGHITSPFAPPRGRHSSAERLFGSSAARLEKGQELGAFRLGSTVVMLWTDGLLSLLPLTVPGGVCFGEKIGMMTQGTAL